MKRFGSVSIITCFILLFTLICGCSSSGEDQQNLQNEQPVNVASEGDSQFSEPDTSASPDLTTDISTNDPVDTVSDANPDSESDLGSGTEESVSDVFGDEVPRPVDVGGNDIQTQEVLHPLNYSDDIDTIIASMTLHEKICQMIIVTPAVLMGSSNVTSADDSMYLALQEYPVGGMILDKSNIVNAAQLSGMISAAQSYATIPMIMTLDEEGGRVSRLQSTLGTTAIGPMYSYHELGTEIASYNAMTIGSDIRRYGFNMDLAPVADVWSNPVNTVIGDRAYSTDFDEASVLVSAAVSGFHMSGVACCIKHFPGHGDTSADSHYGSVYVYKTLDELRANEFKPFISGINAGADAVMIGHLVVSDCGDVPALFSHKLLTDVLRNELGFNGVIMSDSLQMKAMTDHYGVADIPVMAVSAGCDVLLMPTNLEVTVSSLETAVQNGVISEERINQSVRRILLLKKKYI